MKDVLKLNKRGWWKLKIYLDGDTFHVHGLSIVIMAILPKLTSRLSMNPHNSSRIFLFRNWEVDPKNNMDMQMWPGGYKAILKKENKVGGYWISLLDLPAKYHSWGGLETTD